MILKVIATCANCDVCRIQMEDDCLFFPELYRLYDYSEESGNTIRTEDLRHLVELCTLCGLCPCENIRSDIMFSKTNYIEQEGISLSKTILPNIQSMGKICGVAPLFLNRFINSETIANCIKTITGINLERQLPIFPEQSFFEWADRKGLSNIEQLNNNCKSKKPKVAYFAGCSAGYFFPEVGKAMVNILEHNDVTVFVPPQQCCGMPLMIEGDQKQVLKNAQFNMDTFIAALKQGYDIVCSCPTCGYFFKNLLADKAFYSKEYQKLSGVHSRYIQVPLKNSSKKFTLVSRNSYKNLLKDDGYFSSLNPLHRIKISENIMDAGEYLLNLHKKGGFKIDFKPLSTYMSYYAPCHQREQAVGQPYLKLLSYINGLNIKSIGTTMDCCGMGGHLGFKKKFYEKSLQSGKSLFEKIKASNTEAIITDCLSCRLQFDHLIRQNEAGLVKKVFHPLQILAMHISS